MKQFHVYEDWTLEESPRCFYVGKGDDDRVARLKRGHRHSEIVAQHGQRRIVSFTSEDETEVLERERQLIKERHVHPRDPNYNGIGCNVTLGGQGNSGRIVSDETKHQISESKKGKHPNKIWTQAEREATSKRMSELHKGKKISEEQKQLLRELMNEPERKQRMIDSVTVKIRDKYANDPEFVQRIRDTRAKGENSHSPLTVQEVKQIREEWDLLDKSIRGGRWTGLSPTRKFCQEWAQRKGVTNQAIYAIANRKSWKHVI